MPLVGAAAVEFHHQDVIVGAIAVGVQGRCAVRIPTQAADAAQVEIALGVDIQRRGNTGIAVEGVPLVGAVRTQLHNEGVGRLGGEGVQGSGIPIPQPGGETGAGNVELAAGADGDLTRQAAVQVAAVESVPLVGAVRIQLDHRQIIAAAAEGVPRGGAALPQPGVVAFTAYVDTAGVVESQAGPQVFIAGGEEGVPLVEAIFVQFDDDQGHLSRRGMWVERQRAAIAQPARFAVAGNVEIVAVIAGKADQVIVQAGTVEGVPLRRAAAVQFEHKDIRVAAVGVQGWGIFLCQPTAAGAANVQVACPIGFQARGVIFIGAVAQVAVEGVPLVGAAGIQHQDSQVLPAAVGVQRLGVPIP